MKTKVYCNPSDGKLNLEKPGEFREAIKLLRPKRHVLEIKEYSARRSKGANAYYWTVVIPYFCDEMGIDKKSTSEKEYMHYDILGQELRQIPDENRPGKTKTERTRDMSGSRFWKYIHSCGLLFNRQYGGNFPPPKTLGYDTTKR